MDVVQSQVMIRATVGAAVIPLFLDCSPPHSFGIRGVHGKQIEEIIRRRFEHEVGAQWVSYFFFLGNPAFMLAYALGETVLLLLGRLVPAALRAFMLAYSPGGLAFPLFIFLYSCRLIRS